jgi:hypothetical protein
MKRMIKVLGVYFLTAIYCLAIIIVSNNYIQTAFPSKSSVSKDQYFSDISAKLFNHIPKSENILSNKDNLPNSNSKKDFGEKGDLLNKQSNLFDLRFKQYSNLLNKILIHTRKSDLLFPFHYFW